MPTEQATVWIRPFLGNGQDNSTNQSFVIGKNHALYEWPTFRTFRNMGRPDSTPETNTYLRERAETLIANPQYPLSLPILMSHRGADIALGIEESG